MHASSDIARFIAALKIPILTKIGNQIPELNIEMSLEQNKEVYKQTREYTTSSLLGIQY